MNAEKYPLLDRIATPADLRQLDEDQLPQVVDELREYLLQAISTSGGHFSAGMGCVELTVALHYCFETPHDRIIWDVGHQAYPHKILTGRGDQIGTRKKTGGLAPFPKRGESEYDTFGVGHSSTSISAGLGMALASAHNDEDRRGDITGYLACLPLLVILLVVIVQAVQRALELGGQFGLRR